jgi:hypothetical protein
MKKVVTMEEAMTKTQNVDLFKDFKRKQMMRRTAQQQGAKKRR